MTVNWNAIQTPTDRTVKPPRSVQATDIKPRYLSMGSWRADKSKGGTLRPRKLRSRR